MDYDTWKADTGIEAEHTDDDDCDCDECRAEREALEADLIYDWRREHGE